MGTFYARTLGSPLFLCLCPESKSRCSLASPPALQEPPPIQVPQVASQRAMLRAPGGSQAHAHPRFGFMLWLDGQAGTRPSPALLFGGSRSSPFRTHPLHALGFSFNLELLKQGEVARHCFSWAEPCGFSLTSLLSPRERQGWTRCPPELPSTLIPPQLGPTQKKISFQLPPQAFAWMSCPSCCVRELLVPYDHPESSKVPPCACPSPKLSPFLSQLVKPLMLQQ